MRWERDGPVLSVQWKDKVVTMLSSIDNANEFINVNRKMKIADKWEIVEVKQPKVIQQYNMYMNGVDKSDQLLNTNNVLRKCVKWWETLFFHMVDIPMSPSESLIMIN